MNNLKRIAKWIGYIFAGLLGTIALLLLISTININNRLNKVYTIDVPRLNIPTDEESIARGKHLVITRGCTGCHGADLGGDTFIDIPLLGLVYSSNLTSGEGGISEKYSDQDIINAIRYGFKPDGTPLIMMPSNEYWVLDDTDISQIVAYLKTIPPVDRENKENQLGPLGKILILLKVFPAFSVEQIDLTAKRPEPVPAKATIEYGEQLATFCKGCHGSTLSGGPIPGAPSDVATPANLTPGGDLKDWSLEEFITTLRTGVNPNGHQLDPEMPWEELGQMTDTELEAIYLYLQSLPPLEYGNR